MTQFQKTYPVFLIKNDMLTAIRTTERETGDEASFVEKIKCLDS